MQDDPQQDRPTPPEPARYPMRRYGFATATRIAHAKRAAHEEERARAEAAIAALPEGHTPRQAREAITLSTGHPVVYTPHHGARERTRAARLAARAVSDEARRQAHAAAYAAQEAFVEAHNAELAGLSREARAAHLAPHAARVREILDQGGRRHPAFASWVALLVNAGHLAAACAVGWLLVLGGGL